VEAGWLLASRAFHGIGWARGGRISPAPEIVVASRPREAIYAKGSVLSIMAEPSASGDTTTPPPTFAQRLATTILLLIFAVPFAEEGAKRIMDGDYYTGGIAFAIAVPLAVSSIVAAAINSNSRLVQSAIGIALDFRWWIPILMFVFIALAAPRWLNQKPASMESKGLDRISSDIDTLHHQMNSIRLVTLTVARLFQMQENLATAISLRDTLAALIKARLLDDIAGNYPEFSSWHRDEIPDIFADFSKIANICYPE